MNLQDKSKEELITELQKLQAENRALKLAIVNKSENPSGGAFNTLSNYETNLATLRQKAETWQKRKPYKTDFSHAEADTLKLIQELDIHQIELEIQNEELTLAKSLTEIENEKYIELYDFAPTAYFTLTQVGEIVTLNLSGAAMLGKERSLLQNSRFGFFVSDNTKPIFNIFLNKVFNSVAKKTCEVALPANCNLQTYVHLTGIRTENLKTCFVTAVDITERKQAEEALQKSERKLETMLQTMVEGIVTIDLAGEITYCNKAAEHILNMSKNVLGKYYQSSEWNQVDEQGKPYPQENLPLATVLREQRTVMNVEQALVSLNGEWKWISVNAAPLFDWNGKLFGGIASFRDITERKQAEETLRLNEEKYRLLYSNMIEGAALHKLVYNKQGKPVDYIIVEVNPAFEAQLGIPKESVVNKTSKDAYHAADPPYLETYSRVVITGKPETFETYFAPLDKYFSISVYCPFKGSFVTVFENITERKKADEYLKISEVKLKNLVTNMSVGVLLQGPNAEITLSNSKALELLGLTEDQLMGRTSFDPNWNVIREDGSPFPGNTHPVPQAIATRLPVRSIIMGVYRPLTNDRAWLLVDAVPQLNGDGSVNHVICSFIDISKRKQVEKELRESEEKYRLLTENTADVIWVLNLTTGKFTYISPSVFQLRAFTAEEAMHETLEDSLTTDSIAAVNDAIVKNAHNFIEHPEIPNYYINEVQQYCKDGAIIWVEVSTQFRYNPSGDIEVVGVSRNIDERKKAENALRASEEKFKAIIETSPDGIAITALDGTIQFVTTKVVSMWGYDSTDELIGRNAMEFVHPDYREKAIFLIAEMFNGNLTGAAEYMMVRKDGSTFYGEANANILRDANNNPTGILYIERDITERKQAEKALSESQQRYRLLIETAIEGIGVAQGPDLKFVNPMLCVLTGYSERELMSIPFLEFIHPDDRNMVLMNQKKRLSGEAVDQKYHLRIIRKDNSIFWVEMSGVKIEWEGLPATMNFVSDITERKQAEEALRETNSYLENLINYANAPIIVWDPQFRITRFNHAFEHLTGLTEKEVLGQSLEILFPPALAKNSMQLISNTLTGERWETVEIQIQHNDNSVRTVLWNSATLFTTDGKTPVATIAQGQDITDRKKTEALLLQAKQEAEMANKAKSIFLANMSHEIRTPLNSIIGFSQLMNRDKALSDTQKDYNTSIIRSGEHLLMLINDILELSKVEAGRIVLNPVNVDLPVLFNDLQLIFKEKAQSKHLRFVFETAADLPRYVLVDESKLRQIFINLIGNALKFTNEGGITVRVRFDKVTEATSRLFVEIQDSGPGIPEHEITSLFKHFVQTTAGIKKGSGAGLGLALSLELAQLMGGNISVSSEVGKGSLFKFYVEIKEGATETIKPVIAKHIICIDKDQKTYRILVVDDKKENLQVVVKLLKMVGFETNEAVNGEEAIEKFENWSPDLILMDLRMPVMDGYEATRRIKLTEKGKQTPIVALTANTLESDKNRIETMGIQGYICKPFRENELFTVIGKILDIHYIYEDDTSLSQVKYLSGNEDAISKDIARLPDSLRLKMLEALAVADIKRLKSLIGSFEQDNSELAHRLLTLAKNYDYDHLQQILNTKINEKH
ncbi:MAG: PAS domain S-box protein [Bacteroidetes bacterium]|nr:PAS domain S-box protein [Bacteroidota bacterium]